MGKPTEFNKQEQRTILFRLLSYTTPHLKKIIFAFILLALATLGEIVGPLMIGLFIDDYLAPRNLPLQPLLILGGGYLAIQVGKIVHYVFSTIQISRNCFKNYPANSG